MTVRLNRAPEHSWEVLLIERLVDERALLGAAIVLNDRIAVQPYPAELEDAFLVLDRLIEATNRRYVSEIVTRRARVALTAARRRRR